MADTAALPKPEVRPLRWAIQMRSGARLEILGVLRTADSGWLKFTTESGVRMYPTDTIASCEELR